MKQAAPGEGLGTCLQDTLETSVCANRLFPTARLSCKQRSIPLLMLKRCAESVMNLRCVGLWIEFGKKQPE